MAMSMVALRVVRSVLPRALYLDMARLTTRGLVRSRRAGVRCQDGLADGPCQVGGGAGGDARGRTTWSRAAFRAVVKLARSGSVPGSAAEASAMAVRSAW